MGFDILTAPFRAAPNRFLSYCHPAPVARPDPKQPGIFPELNVSVCVSVWGLKCTPSSGEEKTFAVKKMDVQLDAIPYSRGR